MDIDRAIGLLVGLAFGDVYGLDYEYWWPRPRELWLDVKDLDFGCYDECDKKCCYSDDTEMAIILAESILSQQGFKEDNFAKLLSQKACRNYRARFYGYSTKKVIAAIRSGIPWYEASRIPFNGLGSYGNGAAIRVAPIAIFAKDISEVEKLSKRQAIVTHRHSLAIEGSILIALAQRFVLEGIPPSLLIDKLLSYRTWLPEFKKRLEVVEQLLDSLPPIVAKTLGNTSASHESTVTAIYIFIKSQGDALKALAYSISVGGDVDSIAAMALSLVGAYKGYKAFPQDLLNRIENIDYIINLAKELYLLHILNKLKGSSSRY
ncbi:MAG TPA: ADP-ribosylglycohydrolase family protein [Ignisphaera sp.]|nr:ADP-ribosylglycohydrolase family protein [Ignisphaera sp.]